MGAKAPHSALESTKMQIEEVCASYLKQGLCSHIFLAGGRFSEGRPRLSFEHLPNTQTIFDLSSLTKALVTTPLVFKSIDMGQATLDSTIGEWLEQASVPSGFSDIVKSLTLASLLRHESGLAFWKNFYVECGVQHQSQDLVAGLNAAARNLANRGVSVYSDLSFLLLGKGLELLENRKIGGLHQDFLTYDLSLPQTLQVGAAKQFQREQCIPTGYCAIRQRELQGEVHDENCWRLGGFTGHSGLFASGPALVTYLARLAAHPVGKQMLEANAAAIKAPPNAALLGLRQATDPSSETFGGGYAMGHMGFTGTALWIDRDLDRYAVVLTNRVAMGRIPTLIKQFRRDIFALLHQVCL